MVENKVLVVGAVHLDVLVEPDNRRVNPTDNPRDKPGRVTYALGGTAFNIASGLKHMGVEPTLWTMLDTGLISDAVVKAVDRTGIHAIIARQETLMPAGFVVWVSDGDMQQAVCSSPLENLDLPPSIAASLVAERQMVVLDGNLSLGATLAFAAAARARNIPVWWCATSDIKVKKARALAGQMNLIALNRYEVSRLLSAFDIPGSGYQELAHALEATLLVTRDEDGAALVTDEGMVVLPSLTDRDHSRIFLGAGDALLAGVLVRRLAGADWRKALEDGLEQASRVSTSVGCNSIGVFL